jgi:hypothetical protein
MTGLSPPGRRSPIRRWVAFPRGPTEVAGTMTPVSAAPETLIRRPATDPLAILHQVYGYAAFRGAQQAIVEHVTAGGDALVLMPTGGGKSLCYQVPAIARHRAGQGVAVVVSPLIALMHDQVGALDELGVPAAFLNSTLDGDEARRIERELLAGRLVMLYAAPERLLTPRFLAMLDSLSERGAAQPVRDRRGALRQPVGPRFPRRVPGPERAARALSGGATPGADRHRRRAHPGRHGRAPGPAAGQVLRQQLRPSEHPLHDRREDRPEGAAAALPARRARRRRRHRLLPEPAQGGRHRGLAGRPRASRPCPTTPGWTPTPGAATRTASCARTAW